MLKFRHFRHPICCAHSLYRIAHIYACKRLAKRQFRNIRRGHRDHCWCGGELLPFNWHESYGVCSNCGCYVNKYPPIPEELRKFYSLDNYWGAWMRLKGAPTIEHRTENDLQDGRVEYWLSLIGRYGPWSGRVTEVGCGHAVLLQELDKQGYSVLGVEISDDVSDWVRRNTGLQMITGAFPQVELPECDMFLAFDVLEHVHDPVSFLRKAHSLLRPGGIAILQQPTVRPEQGYTLDPPLGVDFERMFDDVEHLWIFTSLSLRKLADSCGFYILDDGSRWRQCHEILVLKREAGGQGT